MKRRNGKIVKNALVCAVVAASALFATDFLRSQEPDISDALEKIEAILKSVDWDAEWRRNVVRDENGILYLSGDMLNDEIFHFNRGLDKKKSVAYCERPYNECLGYRREAARTTCLRNLGAIRSALLAYAKDHDGYLPPTYSTDTDGTPLHSWRTLILPYLSGFYQEPTLCEQIRFNEPWDSEWNSQFYDLIPRVYRCEAASSNSVRLRGCGTYVTAIVGEGTAFPAPEPGVETTRGLRVIETKNDGTPAALPRVMLVAERDKLVCWMRPDGELTLAEVENGQFLTKMRERPAHSDKRGDPYILAAFLDDRSVCLLNKYVEQGELTKMAVCGDGDKDDEKTSIKNRAVIFK